MAFAATPRYPTYTLPYEDPKTTLTRICDNRLRVIRFWRNSAHRRAQNHIDFLRANLIQHVQRFAQKYPGSKEWYENLGRLIVDIDVSDDNSIAAVYNYLGVSGSWSRR